MATVEVFLPDKGIGLSPMDHFVNLFGWLGENILQAAVLSLIVFVTLAALVVRPDDEKGRDGEGK